VSQPVPKNKELGLLRGQPIVVMNDSLCAPLWSKHKGIATHSVEDIHKKFYARSRFSG